MTYYLHSDLLRIKNEELRIKNKIVQSKSQVVKSDVRYDVLLIH